MRSSLGRSGMGAVLVVVGLALALAGTGFALTHGAVTEGQPAQASQPAQERGDGLAADVRAALELLGVRQEAPPLHVEPEAARTLPLPGVTLRRDLEVAQAGARVELDVDLAAGSHRSLGNAGEAGVESASVSQRVVPAAAPVAAAAAAAFTLAGLLAYFWGGVKTWAFRLLVLPLVPLYAKVTRAEVFDNDVRERIFHAIKARPGIAASELAKAAGVSWGTTIYHLDVLEQTQMVTSLREGRYRRYFENGAVLPGSKQVVAILQNAVTADVARLVRERPGATQKELAAAVGMSPQALHWHLARLTGAGVVRKEREGRVVRHFAQ